MIQLGTDAKTNTVEYMTCPTLVGQIFKLGSSHEVGQVQPPNSILLE